MPPLLSLFFIPENKSIDFLKLHRFFARCFSNISEKMISIAIGVSFSANLFRRLCVSASINCEENYSLTGFEEVSP